MKHVSFALLLLLCVLASCAKIAPAPSDLAPDPGLIVDRKPDIEEVLPQAVFEGQGIIRPESGEMLRQLEEQNRQFNERVREVIARSPQREADPMAGPMAETDLGESQPLSMNFYDADLVEVIRLFMSLLDADYILHPQVSGRVSLSISDSFRPDQMLNLLEGILRINGMVMHNLDGVFEFMPLSRAPSQLISGGIHFPEDGLTPRRGQMIQGFRLHFIRTEDMTTIIKPYLSEGAQVFSHEDSGIMLVCDYPHSLVRIAQLIKVFDESVFANLHVATYTLYHVQAEDAAKELEDVAKAFRLGPERGMRAQVSFLPLARLNMLLALAQDKLVLEFVDVWVRELDRALPAYIQEQYGEGVYVYYAQYGNASEIVASLQGLFEYVEPKDADKDDRTLPGDLVRQDDPQETEGQPVGGPRVVTPEFPALIRDAPFPTPTGNAVSATGKLTGPVVFVVDEPNNAVLLRCSTADYPKIMAVIEMLDQYPRQVLIEVIIAEVQLTEKMQLGMEWRMLDYKDGIRQDLAIRGGPDFPPLSSGLSYVIRNTDRLMASLKASAADGHVRILSTPTLLASDNKEAVINIGQEVPIATSKVVRSDTTNDDRTEYTYQYRDTGIILKVTPKVNKQGMVRMEISQEVSDWYIDVDVGRERPIITTRHAQTHVAVNDQQTIVIGGLMRQAQKDSNIGVPGLNRVPVLKYLFGFDQKEFENTELILFITPHVVVDEEDSSFITRGFLQRLEQIKSVMR